MRKETINTFSDGMSLDLNPLGTPAKTLTNCLNGTLITYNGNELTLQNDMGNIPVGSTLENPDGTAYLPLGYVPIGMKEYGGIIYVASYNPKTNKGQLGCFPSPQLIYISEAALTSLEINIQTLFIEFFTGKDGEPVPVIQWNEYKEEIFKDSTTQEARIFNTGDTFLIKTDQKLSDDLRTAIDENVLNIKLQIIPLNGEAPIDLTDCENFLLRTYNEPNESWNKDLWIFLNVSGVTYTDPQSEELLEITESIPFETILNKYRGFLQAYKGPQGTLQIIFEFNTFSLFNLYRTFRLINNEFIVRFIGEATADMSDPCTPVSQEALTPLALYGNINFIGHNLNTIELLDLDSSYLQLLAKTGEHRIYGYNKLFYDIMPASKYGILKLFNNSFLKSGELTNALILASHNKITNWDFEIDNTIATIKWTYTTFEGDPYIEHMRFVFIPLDRVLEQGGKSKSEISLLYVTESERTEPESPNIYTINKLYYSGDFEDLVKIGPDDLLPNYIYLCRLDVIYNNQVVNGQEYKLLYTGTYFNDKDVQDYSNDNRPLVELTCDLSTELTYTVNKITYTVLLESEEGTTTITMPDESLKNFIIETKDSISANDIMFLANHDKYFNKIIGIIINAECEVTSTLSVDPKLNSLRPLYAGTFDSEKTLDGCAIGGEIKCIIEELDTFKYEGNGDEEVQYVLKKYVEDLQLNLGPYSVPLNGATISYIKEGHVYRNTSSITIHRGMVSRIGLENFYSTLNEGLFPVYDPNDAEYNEKLFGFNLDEDGNLSNIIGANRFTGLAMWLAKNRELDATTVKKDSMISYEREFQDKTALSRYDFKEQERLVPYHYGSYISEGIGLVNLGSEGVSRIEAMKECNYAPILIIATNEYGKLWDLSYWDGDVDSRITNLMCLPHSDIYENLEEKLKLEDHEDNGREKYYGRSAKHIRENHIVTDSNVNIDSAGTEKRSLFHATHGAERAMYILWRSLYGYLVMNVATNLATEQDTKKHDIIIVEPVKLGNKVSKLKVSMPENLQYECCETHLRADHMLLCLLSQILITKRRNADLLLNAPDISLIYSTIAFKTKAKLTINGQQEPVIVLNEQNIEDLLLYIMNNNILDPQDNFVPKFNSTTYTNGYIDCGGKITNTTNRFGLTNIENLFYCEGTPEFSTLEDPEQRFNIYPGKITKILGTYVCQLEKNDFGLYKINTDLVDEEGKFYKIFLPTILSQSNKEGAKYWCQNTDTYKQILEGFAYNDVLLPLTQVMRLQGKEVTTINSQDDLEDPFFNLLYYNSINLKWHMLKINGGCEDITAPTDFSHGFAFITLFGDQSRFIDAQVWRKNSVHGLNETEMEVNVGFYDKDNGPHPDCVGQFVYWENPYTAWKSYTCPDDLFILGTEDWTNCVTNTQFTYNTVSLTTNNTSTAETPDPLQT